MPLMACRHLTIYYENQCAVKDVSFDIEAGDYICIVGENGSGKSSLVKGLLGLLLPADGKRHLRGRRSAETPSATCLSRRWYKRTFRLLFMKSSYPGA